MLDWTRGLVNWPVRSPDISCLDIFLWGHVKSLVYASPVNTHEALTARIAVVADKFDDDIQKVTPARAPLSFSLLSNSALMSKSFSFDLLRLRAKTAWLWLPQSASLTVRCPQRYVHRDQRRI
ncbi:hypothetical protein TNCV_2795291 [Trichonephila clavipes]|nr:hypothetical protein TNCV_2795291 [Trichonephila clavipes]